MVRQLLLKLVICQAIKEKPYCFNVLALLVLKVGSLFYFIFFSRKVDNACRMERRPNSSVWISSRFIHNASSASSLDCSSASLSTLQMKNVSSVGTTKPLYSYRLGRVVKNLNSVTVNPVSSFTSRIKASFMFSPISTNPPGRSSVPFAGALLRRSVSNCPLLLSIKAATAALGFK